MWLGGVVAGAASAGSAKPVAVQAQRCGSGAAGKLSESRHTVVTRLPRPCENAAKFVGKV